MKKILALVVAFALCFTAVAGCITTSAEDAAAPAIEISSVELANTAGATSFTVSGTNCGTIAAQKLTVTIENGVKLDSIYNGATPLIDAANVATGEDADYYVETVEGNTVVTLVSVLNIGAANDTFTYTFNVTVPANETEEAVVYDVTAATVAGSIDEEYINVEIAPATITVAAKAAEPQGPTMNDAIVLNKEGVVISSTLDVYFQVRKELVAEYARAEAIIEPVTYDNSGNEVPGETAVIPLSGGTSKNYAVTYPNIAMYKLGLPLNIYIKCYDAEDNFVAYSDTFVRTPVGLLKEKYVAGSTDATQIKLNSLVTDMLNMAAKAETHFATQVASTSDLATLVAKGDVSNKDWPQDAATQSYGELTLAEAPTYYGDYNETDNKIVFGADLNGAPVITAKFNRATTEYPDHSKLKLELSYTTYYGQGAEGTVKTDVIEGDEWAAYAVGKSLICPFSLVAMYDGNKPVFATLTYDGNTVVTFEYSLENYIKEYENVGGTLGDLLTAIALFNVSSRTYFGTI